MRRAPGMLLPVILLGVLSAVSADAALPRLTGTTPAWAPAATAAVHPGVQTVTSGQQCTANFVFYDASSIYIGQAAHCAGTDGNTATNGCTAGVLPVGTLVAIQGASRSGTIVYSSWVKMQQLGGANDNACRGNDFALVRIHPDDNAKVNPSIPVWGGPAGLATGSTLGESVFGYGNSWLWLGIDPVKPREGISLGAENAGWSHGIYTAPPGIPGDSGSPYLDSDGKALGVLSTIEALPAPASNNLSDLRKAVEYMEANSSLNVTLANGTVPFGA